MTLGMSQRGLGLLEFETKTVESQCLGWLYIGLLMNDAVLSDRPDQAVINLIMRPQVSCTSCLDSHRWIGRALLNTMVIQDATLQ